MVRAAAAYEYLDRRFATAKEGTKTAGIREVLPHIEISHLPSEMQGRAIFFALSCYREHQGEMADPKGIKPLYLLSGVRSWAKFAEQAKCVFIQEVDGEITLIPMKYRGSSFGYAPMMDASLTSLPTPEAMGANLDQAFERCE